jgi:catechol 2,3-dioxygenase-like lactoylglutathione lyase family enzyme
MGHTYNHLSLRERVEIELWRSAGRSLRWIGGRLGRSASTISRELHRNARPTRQWRGAYEGERAHALARRRRRWDARFKLARQPALRADQADGPVSRVHLAFQARDRESVHAFHQAALAHGGRDNGGPGERSYHPGYYAAFALDPDGHNIEAVYHGPAERSAEAVVVSPKP